MKTKIAVSIAIVVSLLFISSKIAFSQDAAPEQSQPAKASSEAVQSSAVVPVEAVKQEPDTQWVWGEVVTADLQKKTVFVKYLDYESDQEKEIEIGVDDTTTYENANSLDELKPKDTVSIDYIVLDGKNIAKNISVEKPEAQGEPQSVQAPVTEANPAAPTIETNPEGVVAVPAQVPEEPQAKESQPPGN